MADSAFIHIAKNKQGTFTSWCKRHGYGGVNSSCISAGKKNDDPRIVKKATFAGNSRGWRKTGPKNGN